MPDLPIVIPDTAVAPKDYTLSGTQELALKTVRALIDGSGAASAFLPTLQLLDPNGHVMWEGATSSTVAAGGSADVSWFPGLGAAAAASAGGTTPVVAVATAINSLTSVPAGGSALVTFEVAGSSDTSKAYWAATSGTPPTASPPRIWLHFKAPAKGTVWVQMSCIWTAGTKIDAAIYDPDQYALPHDGWDSFSGYDANAANLGGPQLMDSTFLVFNVSNADVPIAVRLTNSDAGASTPDWVQLCAMYWPDVYAIGS